MIDQFLVNRTDAVIGWMQERGAPLPLILREATILPIIGGLLLSFGYYREFGLPLAIFFLFLTSLLLLIGVSRMRELTRDANRMDEARIQALYYALAISRRERPAMRYLFLFTFVYSTIAVIGGAPIEGVIFHLTFLVSWYADTALPRWPSERQEDTSRELTPQGI